MKALELLYQYQQADEIAGGYMCKPLNEAIKELEALTTSKQTTKAILCTSAMTLRIEYTVYQQQQNIATVA